MLCASSESRRTSSSMSPYVAHTRMPASLASRSTSGAVKTRHDTTSSAGTYPFAGAPVATSSTLNPTVLSTTCVATSNASPSLPHSTSTLTPRVTSSLSHASPCASVSWPSKRSYGCSSSSTATPPGASASWIALRHASASSVFTRCAAVPRRTHATSNPLATACLDSRGAISTALSTHAFASSLVMSPSTTATRSFSADSATRSLARSSMGAELSTATATAPGHRDATAVECHAGPAPNSSNDAGGRPVPIRSDRDARNAASLSNSLNPNASSYVRGSSYTPLPPVDAVADDAATNDDDAR
mmetsp:Transcript_8908/g.36418  ORF Transcript_8908/g.36418 Transcript_8908/m.36418 type:complete len:302 (-) Transcript_8908:152-1057(-)